MISLRSFFTRIVPAAVVALGLAACSDGSTNPLSRGLSPSGASFSNSGNSGNSAKHGDIDVRVLVDKAGNALLEVRTGTYDLATNAATPDGSFDKIQYKVYNAAGKQVLVKNVNFGKSGISSFFTYVNLCSGSGDDDDDDDGGHHVTPASSCSTKFAAGWKVTVQANLKGVGGDPKKTDVVTETGVAGFFPDIDMTNQAITVVSAAAQTNVVPVGSSTQFSVPIPNNKPAGTNGPGAAAVNVTCVVFVDGVVQLPIPNVKIFGFSTNPNLFSYVDDPSQTIPAGGVGSCQFKLTLAAGSHTIMVTAAPVLPSDFDYSNNSTKTFTFVAISAQPDVSAKDGVFTIGGKLPSAVTLAAGTEYSLEQGILLKSGTPPGIVPCTVTIAKVGGASETKTGSVNLATTGAAASCVVKYTFPSLGDYDVTTTATVPSGFTDTDPSNNTSTTRVTVSTGTPTANVTLGAITYSDPSITTIINGTPTPISSDLSPTAASPEDSVHNKDVASYSAPVNAALQFASSVDVTCSATVDGVAAGSVPGLVWTSGPTLTGVTPTSNRVCSFTVPFNSTNFSSANGNPHTIVFSIASTSITNSATSSTSVTGKLTEFVRADLSSDPLEVQIGTATTWQVLTGAAIPQNSNVKIRSAIHNPSAFPVNVSCGALVKNVVLPTSNVLPVQDVALPVELQATTTTTSAVTIPANGANYCQYTATAPPALGLVSIGLVALQLPVPGATNPQDPYFINNPSAGTFTIVSNGQFTNLPPATAGQSITALQDWRNDPNNKSANVDSLYHQQINVTNLALKVIPTQAVLGYFKLTTTVTSGAGTVASPTQTFGTAVVSGYINQANGGENCDDVVAYPGTKLTGSSPSEPLSIYGQAPLQYYASVCASPSANNQQLITVNYGQELFQPVLGSLNPLLIKDKVVVRMVLDFTLTGSPTPDQVSATITLPVSSFWSGNCSNVGGSPPSSVNCATVFAPFTITTP